MTLPSIELKYNKVTDKNVTNTNTNTNTINNNIFFKPEDGTTTITSEPLTKSPSSNILRVETPLNIKQFKETFMKILISYFKNNIILLNNLVELSEKIITKIDDLTLLISLLTDIPIDKITIIVEEIQAKNCCGKVFKILPRYRKITDIIINNNSSFRISHNTFYVQLQTEYNISLDYILL
jgi:hypothetical protein